MAHFEQNLPIVRACAAGLENAKHDCEESLKVALEENVLLKVQADETIKEVGELRLTVDAAMGATSSAKARGSTLEAKVERLMQDKVRLCQEFDNNHNGKSLYSESIVSLIYFASSSRILLTMST